MNQFLTNGGNLGSDHPYGHSEDKLPLLIFFVFQFSHLDIYYTLFNSTDNENQA